MLIDRLVDQKQRESKETSLLTFPSALITTTVCTLFQSTIHSLRATLILKQNHTVCINVDGEIDQDCSHMSNTAH